MIPLSLERKSQIRKIEGDLSLCDLVYKYDIYFYNKQKLYDVNCFDIKSISPFSNNKFVITSCDTHRIFYNEKVNELCFTNVYDEITHLNDDYVIISDYSPIKKLFIY